MYLSLNDRTILTCKIIKARSLYWLKGRWIWLPNLFLASKWIQLLNLLLTLPCRHLFLRCMTFEFCKLSLNHFSNFEEFHKILTESQHPTEKGSFCEFKVGALISAKEFFSRRLFIIMAQRRTRNQLKILKIAPL